MKNETNMVLISTLKNMKTIIEIHEDIKQSDQDKISKIINEYINKVELSHDHVIEGIALADITALIIKAVK